MPNVFAALLVLIAGSTHSATAFTVEEIISRNVEARGGVANLQALRTLRVTGKLTFGGGDGSVDAVYGQVVVRPGMTRSEVTLQGLTAVDAYDGKDGWSVEPFGGRRDARRVSSDEARAMARDAEIDGPLVGWREKGHQVEYLGIEEVDGTEAHKLRVQRKDGDTQIVYLDPDSFLEIRIVTTSRVRGTERESETDFGDYGQVGGVWIPFAYESGAKGAPKNSHVTIESAEANGDVDPSLFHVPAEGAAVPRALPAGPAKAPEASAARPPSLSSSTPPKLDAGTFSGLGARNIGSAAMSGRISAVAACNENGKTTVYTGAASGGVWKSLDGGTTFQPVFDKQPVQSIGAIAIDPSNPKNVWVGSGEAWTRNSVSIGDGIYKSSDAGQTWKNMGLPESERIVRVTVHPKDGNIVYAAVPGKLWSDSPDRGLYKTNDGGKVWDLVLKGGNLSTGCSSFAMDPVNPDILFAGMWDFRRKGWTFRSGGEGPESPSGSGLYRSADGGKTWTQLDAKSNKGLPEGPWGRVEVVVAPSDAKIVYAVIESVPSRSGLYASTDGGATWEARDRSQMMVWRPFYFSRLVVDPTNPLRLFKPDGGLIVSEDGGKSFSGTGGGSHGDWHDLWINPENPKHVLGGDDGGFWLSYDGGNRWWKCNSLPVSQFYHVSLDADDPYHVYGGLQDNSSWIGDSSYPGGISNSRWENLYGGDGFWTIPDPTDPNAVYAESQGGYIGRVDRRTHAARDIQPKANFKEKLRFNWNAPIHVSTTQKGTLYLGAQFLFRSRDRGENWERISPDLTTNDPEKQKQEESGGVTVDNSSAEMHTTIYSISESPKNPLVIWAGTDDGNVQITRDGGKTWNNLIANVTGLPKNSWVSWIEASRFDAGTAYAAFDRHTFGDMTSWVYRTVDFGKSWSRIAGPGEGVRGYAHCVKEDAVQASLLFVGTEFGLWISTDSGKNWVEFKGGAFPSVAVREVQVQPRENDLVIATHGRGIWIVDDITPLRSLSAETMARPVSFLPGRTVQQRMPANGGWVEGDAAFVGDNPRSGAAIQYYLRSRHMFGPIKLEVLDAQGKLVDTVPAGKRRGLNRVFWSMRVKPPRVPRAAQVAFNSSQGPRVPPGTYTVRLTNGPDVAETNIVVGVDRRAPYSALDRKAQYDAMTRAGALFNDMSALVDRLDATRSSAGERAKTLPAGDPLGAKVQALRDKLDETKKKVVATKEGGAITGEERIREHLDTLYGAISYWEGKPTSYQLQAIDTLKRELAEVATQFDAIVAKDVAPLNEELKKAKLEPIIMSWSGPAESLPGGAPAAVAGLRALHVR